MTRKNVGFTLAHFSIAGAHVLAYLGLISEAQLCLSLGACALSLAAS